MIKKRSTIAMLSLSLIIPLGGGCAAEAPLDLKWAQLMPVAPPKPVAPKPFFAGMPAKSDDNSAPPPPPLEGKFMATKRRQPGGDAPPAIVPELDGKRISIGGYIVPLDFDSTSIKEFLLVPYVGACIHVPPPPSNQIIFVKSDKGIEITGPFDPVTVTGTIKTETAFTGLADAGYSLSAETVEVLKN